MILETHTLVSEQHVDRCLLMLRSLMTHVPVHAFLHDDGSLTATSIARIRAELTGVSIVTRDEADLRAADRLAGHPSVHWLRGWNVRCTQLVDYFLWAQQPRVLAVDSDVLFLREPRELLQWLSGRPDQGAQFAYSPETGWEAKGVHWLPEAVPGRPFIPAMCCGFVAVDVAAFFDLDYLEDLIRHTEPQVREQQRFVTQMYYSLLGGRLPADRVQSLGEAYRSGRLEWLPDYPDRAICHYFGSHDNLDGVAEVFRRYPAIRETVGG